MALAKIGNIQHAAYRCKDAAQTRWFYEDVLGLPCKAAFAFDGISGTDIPRRYMHLFFELGDGNFIAFFDDPSTAMPEHFDQRHGFDVHVAFEIDSMEDLAAWKKKIREANITCAGPVDHHFVKSIYFYDPNGLQCEITCKTEDYTAIMTKETIEVDDQMQKWTEETRALKESRFGADSLDSRQVKEFLAA
ncbi:VOC family protein [Hyphomonas sp.]|uniref:VOC family protein n=1 Tax=Hyphomonas sp. TaxID=87 RepID=UPI0035668C7F